MWGSNSRAGIRVAVASIAWRERQRFNFSSGASLIEGISLLIG